MGRYVTWLGTDWITLLVSVALLLLASESGFRIGHRLRKRELRRERRTRTLKDRSSQANTLVAAMLALLGLLLAFSFSIVEGRLAARKQLVLDEANAIGTLYLRTKTLPEPYGGQIAALIRKYVELRSGHENMQDVRRAITQSEAYHARIWTKAAAVALRYPESEVVGLFISALNRVIDLHQSRVTVGLYQRLPVPILSTIYIISFLGIAVFGYACGLGTTRSLLPTGALIAAIAVVLTLIVGIDHPMGNVAQISEAALEDVQQTLSRDRRGADERAKPASRRDSDKR